MLSENELCRNVRVWAHAARLVKKEHGELPDECRRYYTIRTIIDLQIRDVVENSERLIGAAGVHSADDVRRPAENPDSIQFRTPRFEPGTASLSLPEPLLQPGCQRAAPPGEPALKDLFNYYLKHPAEIGGQARRRSAAPACIAPFAITWPG